jgi:hypothetical protein
LVREANVRDEPIVEKLRQDAQALIASGELEPLGVAEWAHKELLERLEMDPPEGIADLPEKDRDAIYCFVMGYICALRF